MIMVIVTSLHTPPLAWDEAWVTATVGMTDRPYNFHLLPSPCMKAQQLLVIKYSKYSDELADSTLMNNIHNLHKQIQDPENCMLLNVQRANV